MSDRTGSSAQLKGLEVADTSTQPRTEARRNHQAQGKADNEATRPGPQLWMLVSPGHFEGISTTCIKYRIPFSFTQYTPIYCILTDIYIYMDRERVIIPA